MAWDCRESARCCLSIAACICGRCDRVVERRQCHVDEQQSSSEDAITGIRTYIRPSSYRTLSVQFRVMSIVSHLRGQAFSVKTFLISDMFLLCRLDKAGASLDDGRAIVTAGLNSRIAIRCMGAVDCLW
jgi:hypothetical protein